MSDSSKYVTTWDWGECSTDVVDTFLTSQRDGTFLVYKTSDTLFLTLAIRTNGENKYVRIYHEDNLYGFTEPLGFESLEDALDAYNWSPTVTGNTLKYPAAKPDSPLHRTYSRSSRTSLHEASPLQLLKDLRCETSLKMEKDERYGSIEEENRSLEKKLLEITNSLDAINTLTKIIETQIDKSKRMKLRSSVRTQASEAFDKNFLELTARLSDLNGEKRQLTEEANTIQIEKNKVEKQQACLYKELKEIAKGINAIRRTLLRRNPLLDTFLDRLLDEELQSNAGVQVLNINKSDAENMLESTEDGSFVVRDGIKDNDKPYIISVRYQGQTRHFPVLEYEGCYGLDEDTCIFINLNELVNLYSQVSFSVHDSQYETLTLCHQIIYSLCKFDS